MVLIHTILEESEFRDLEEAMRVIMIDDDEDKLSISNDEDNPAVFGIDD